MESSKKKIVVYVRWHVYDQFMRAMSCTEDMVMKMDHNLERTNR